MFVELEDLSYRLHSNNTTNVEANHSSSVNLESQGFSAEHYTAGPSLSLALSLDQYQRPVCASLSMQVVENTCAFTILNKTANNTVNRWQQPNYYFADYNIKSYNYVRDYSQCAIVFN